METIHIALAADENYAQHAGITLLSILARYKHKNPLSIVILSNGISAASKEKLISLAEGRDCTIACIEIEDEQFGGVEGRKHYTKATYCRLFLPELLPESVDKILYLDTDVIVRHDITPLWETDISQHHAAAVEDLGMKSNYVESLGIPLERLYFNAGVLLMNLRKWREDNTGGKCLDYALNPPKPLVFVDQDALNVTLQGKWLPVDLKWNVTRGYFKKTWKWRGRKVLPAALWDAVRDPAIIHFTSTYKPWCYACGVPFAEEYMVLVEDSPWKGYQYPDINLKSYLKRKEYHLRQRLAEVYHADLLRQ